MSANHAEIMEHTKKAPTLHGPKTAGPNRGVEFAPGLAKFVTAVSAVAVVMHLLLRFLTDAPRFWAEIPLYGALAFGGAPLVVILGRELLAGEFGSDFLAGLSIVTAVLLREYLVATIVVLMLSGGTTLETFATRRASRVLEMLAKGMPTIAHRRAGEAIDVPVGEIAVGDLLVVLPHEICLWMASLLRGTGT